MFESGNSTVAFGDVNLETFEILTTTEFTLAPLPGNGFDPFAVHLEEWQFPEDNDDGPYHEGEEQVRAEYLNSIADRDWRVEYDEHNGSYHGIDNQGYTFTFSD